jgi:hypothetical protein
LLVFLRDGVLRAEYHGHGHDVQEMEATVGVVFDNGDWKDVRVIKRRDVLSLVVDGHKSVSMQVPRRLHLGRHFTIGGWHHHEESKTKHVSTFLFLHFGGT